MSQISRRELDHKVEKELLESLEYVFTHTSPAEIKKVLSSLMTKTERLMVAKRLGIAAMLSEGIPYSTIDDGLKVTRATIGKIELLIQTRSEGFGLALKKLRRREVKETLKDLLLQVAKYSVRAAGGRLPRVKF